MNGSLKSHTRNGRSFAFSLRLRERESSWWFLTMVLTLAHGGLLDAVWPALTPASHLSHDLRKIHVNTLPSTVDCEEEAGVSSPNSTISSTISGGKRSAREGTDEEEDAGGETSRKKLRLSKDQSAFLEETFKEHNTLNPKQKLALSKKLSMTARQVEVWFQNRRARTKLKQTEVDCEYLKRCVEKLTEENRRLLKEAMELRTLKLSPQFYGQMTPPTTLIMCPSCERVAGPSSNHHQTHRPVAINPWVPRAGQVAHGLDFEALRS
ncbi:hypothetical protein F2Q69_00041818 [Brassica cretica]|uniref:Homeobox domain-containing protein n=1 Tax=Brassica cretica TaxID=69181 RepID=A0A8S9N9J6_BRACR|nr:hypothetical protein F2Q69_00041818 [Brassica cretica]